MVRMKHLLRKLHIGGGGGAAAGGCGDHHAHTGISDHRGNPLPPLPASVATSSSTSSSSNTAASTRGRGSSIAAPAAAAAGNPGHGSRPLSSSSSSPPPPSSATSVSNTSSTRGQGAAASDSDESTGSRGQGSGLERPAAAPDGYSFFEEEYQMQLALAISVSDPDGREDPESAQINAAKRMSLGCTPVVPVGVTGQSNLVEFLSQRYWNYNILNYDEKVVDGFYDVYGIIASSNAQGKMPLLVDLQSVPISEKVDYEVILVNRTTDQALQQLEKHAISISLQCRSAELGPFSSGLIQKIADLVVDNMGGPVCDAEEILRKWTAKSYKLRTTLNSIVLPLGCLEIGLSRHRALLFKVLADRIDLPCRLVKGSYYTGTDEGAVNLIKVDDEREFIIDLMGAPGALIPAEMPSCHIQTAGFNLVDPTSITQTVKDLSLALGSKTNWKLIEKREECISSVTGPHCSASQGEGRVSSEPLIRGNDRTTINLMADNQRHDHDSSDLPLFTRMKANTSAASESELSAQQSKLNDVSKFVVSAVKNPQVAQKLHAMLVESGASPPPDLFLDLDGSQYAENTKKKSADVNMKQEKWNQSTWSSGAENTISSSVSGLPDRKQKQCESSEKKDTLNINSVSEDKNMELFAAVREEKNSSADQSQFDINSSSAQPAFNMLTHTTNCNPSDGTTVNHMRTEVDTRLQIHSERQMASMSGNSYLPTTKANDSSSLPSPVLDGVAECEIPWEDLQIGERIGLGSYGEVYRGDWNGTEVAVKKFLDQDLSGDALEQFRCEIQIMLRLRHPNVVLFMGAVTRPPNLSILTEFLPRGSLYRLLHRPHIHIDEKRRLKMALDVARGMNYLHTSHPPIVHRDLKSPNLLVDKNWVVKVCDFGLSRLKHHTFLSSKSTAGTPEWMAPEVLRNERSNEKCDVYSFGVILWELATLKMPWSGMNPMQVVGAVGFQNRRLDIPKEVDSIAAKIIQSCWLSDPNERPSFGQLMTPLKQLQRLTVDTSC